MDRSYWERIAHSYNEEIFDVFRNDKAGIINSAIRAHHSPTKTVIDVGCAVGKWIPILSVNFKKVIATDISAKNIELAKKNCQAFSNVHYIRADMSDPTLRIMQCDVAVCINALLTSSLSKRIIFFKSLSKCVKKGGTLILVVPSLESSLYTGIIKDRWKIDGTNNKKLTAKEYARMIKNIKQGNIEIDHVPTKHYLDEELTLLLSKEKFSIVETKKVEYNWKTEFLHPPKWLKGPYPWDWMCIAKRN
jgi:2-polyprenyl-3-methyl-5-hydroxy-6-metoxy-1,4-benzoquinol methylase